MQIAPTAVVTQTRPPVQHFVGGGNGQRDYIREGRNEAVKLTLDGGDLGLLQHNLGDPNAVGGWILLPRQILAAVCFPPAQQRRRYGRFRACIGNVLHAGSGFDTSERLYVFGGAQRITAQ